MRTTTTHPSCKPQSDYQLVAPLATFTDARVPSLAKSIASGAHPCTTPPLVESREGKGAVQVHAYNGCEHTLVVLRDGRLASFGARGALVIGKEA